MGLINYMGLWVLLLVAVFLLAPAVPEGLAWILLLAVLIGGLVFAGLDVCAGGQRVWSALGARRSARKESARRRPHDQR